MLDRVFYHNDQLRKIKIYSSAFIIIFLTVFLMGNILTALLKDNIKINEKSYTLKEGFPIFTSQEEYINFIKDYPYNPGVRLMVHKMRSGQSYWDILKRHKISIDTFIAANPFLTSLIAEKNTEVVIPIEDGVLMAFNDIFDVWIMSKRLKYNSEIMGDYFPTFFKIISTDDIRLVFFKNSKPVLVNNSLEKLYMLGKVFQSPIKGYYTSLFGDRVDPFLHGMAFHSGVDIKARMRTPINAARDGMVTFTGWKTGYGNTIIVQHNDGYATLYGHCSAIKAKIGDWVTKSDTIALVGSTGRSTGSHLHFEVKRHGKHINPLLFVW